MGLCFGLTSGIITTVGMMVGLEAGTHSTLAVIGGILTIALADAFSDALGMHVSQESGNNSEKHVWESTISTFLIKLSFPLTFLIPVLLFSLKEAVNISVLWGLFVLGILSYFIAKDNKTSSVKVIAEHLSVALVVIFVTRYVGEMISTVFV